MNRLNLLRLASVAAFVVAVLLLLALLAPQPRARRPTLSIGLVGDRVLLLATRGGASSASPTAAMPTLALARPRGEESEPREGATGKSPWSEPQQLVDADGSIVPWPTWPGAEPHPGERARAVLIWYQETIAYHPAETSFGGRDSVLPSASMIVRIDAEALFPRALRQRYPRALLGDVAILPSTWTPARAPQTQTAPRSAEGDVAAGIYAADGDAAFPPLLMTYLVGDTFAFIVRFPDGRVGEYTAPLSVVPGMPPIERAPLPAELRLYDGPEDGAKPAPASRDTAATNATNATNLANSANSANKAATGNDTMHDRIAPTIQRLRTLPGPDGQLDVLYTIGKKDMLTWANLRVGSRVPERHREMPVEVPVFDAVRSGRGVEVVCVGQVSDRDKREWLSMLLTRDVSDRFSEIVRTPVFNGGGPPPASASAIALTLDGDTVRGAYLAFAQGYEFSYPTDTDAGATHVLYGPHAVQELNQLMNQPPHMLFIMAMTGLLAVTFVVFMMVRLRNRAQLAAERAAQLRGPPETGTTGDQTTRNDADSSADDQRAPDAESEPTNVAGTGSATPEADESAAATSSVDAAQGDSALEVPNDDSVPDATGAKPATESDAEPEAKKDPLPYDATADEIEERLGFLPAGMLLRVLALLIDFFILIPPIYLLGEAFGIRVDDFGLYFQGGPDSLAAHSILALVHFCYFSGMEYYFGRSLGKMVCAIRVRDAGTLKAPTLRGILIRNALRVVDYYFFFLMIMFTEKQQRFGDLLGHTIVSRDKPKEQDQDFGF